MRSAIRGLLTARHSRSCRLDLLLLHAFAYSTPVHARRTVASRRLKPMEQDQGRRAVWSSTSQQSMQSNGAFCRRIALRASSLRDRTGDQQHGSLRSCDTLVGQTQSHIFNHAFKVHVSISSRSRELGFGKELKNLTPSDSLTVTSLEGNSTSASHIVR